MAVLWSRTIGENHYEVRAAGRSVRLYRNGVHHTQYNPVRPLAGSVWDLLVLPALHRPEGELREALILGFGAGAAGRLLHELLGFRRVVGIELDPVHLSIADGFFDCGECCELLAADAVEWVQGGGDGSRHDLIIDDLYAEDSGYPVRMAPMDLDWCRRLAAMLTPGGMLVFNLVEPGKVRTLPPARDPALRKRFPHRRVFRIQGYENRVVAFSARPLDPARLREGLLRIGRIHPRCYGVARHYISRPLSA